MKEVKGGRQNSIGAKNLHQLKGEIRQGNGQKRRAKSRFKG